MNEATKDQDLALIRLYLEGETTEEQTTYIEKQIQENKAFKEKMEAYRIKFVAKKEIDALLFFASPPRPSVWNSRWVQGFALLGVLLFVVLGGYSVYKLTNLPAKTEKAQKEVLENEKENNISEKEVNTNVNTEKSNRQDAVDEKPQAYTTLLQCLEGQRLSIISFYQDSDSLPTLTRLVGSMQDEFDRKDMQGIVEKMKAQTEIMTKLTEKISATTLKEILQHTQKLYTVLRSIDKQYYGSSRSSPENDNTYTINPSEQEATLQQACQKLPALIEKLKVQKQLWWKTILRKLKN